MERLIGKYARKIIDAGLATEPLICGIDDEAFWNRADDSIPVLQEVLEGMNINSLIVAEPAEPYHTILGYLAGRYPDTITPSHSLIYLASSSAFFAIKEAVCGNSKSSITSKSRVL